MRKSFMSIVLGFCIFTALAGLPNSVRASFYDYAIGPIVGAIDCAVSSFAGDDSCASAWGRTRADIDAGSLGINQTKTKISNFYNGKIKPVSTAIGCALYALADNDICEIKQKILKSEGDIAITTTARVQPAALYSTRTDDENTKSEQPAANTSETADSQRQTVSVIEKIVEKQLLIITSTGITEIDLQELENKLRMGIAKILGSSSGSGNQTPAGKLPSNLSYQQDRQSVRSHDKQRHNHRLSIRTHRLYDTQVRQLDRHL